jgi:hypothetical protein
MELSFLSIHIITPQSLVHWINLGFEVFMAVKIHILVFWVMTLQFGRWIPVFWRNILLHLESRSEYGHKVFFQNIGMTSQYDE